MKVKLISLFAVVALFVMCKSPVDTDVPPDTYTISLKITGNVAGDSVAVSSKKGKAGDAITVSYTLAGGYVNNQLIFSVAANVINTVTTPGSSTWSYTVNNDDAIDKTITINATFTHTNKQIDTIAFSENSINKTYGDTPFIETVSNSGQGTGAITYSSGDASIATVNSGDGQVTIVKAGSVTITATKAADPNYEGATANYTLHIAQAAGGTVTAPTQNSVTSSSITVNTVSAPSTGQSVEYAISISNTAPASGWQSGTQFTGLSADTNYYIFARSASNTNYNAGTAAMSAPIKTDPLTQPPGEITPAEIVDFEKDAAGKTYESTKGGSAPTVAVVADPAHAGQKSLRVNSTDYNQAAIVPINLPYELHNYKNLTFRFNYASGSLTNQEILVYAAKSAGTFVQYGFGNPADSQYAQFAANLAGTASPNYSAANQWQNLTVTITNPGSAISGLKGDIYLAIGININSSITYLLDDITFTIKDSFVPPPPPPPGPTPPSTGAVTSGNYRNLFKEFGKTDQEVDAKVNAAWNQLFVNGTADQKIYYEVAGDMAYVLDSGNNDVRSEGMSYGMMMAVQMNDQTRFNKMWKWAHTYMYNDRTVKTDDVRGYFSWQCNTDGTRKDKGVAPDGEFYFVTALLFASARWGDGSGINEYGRWARYILYDMINRDSGGLDNWGASTMFNLTNHLPLFTTSGAGTGGAGGHTDPSYILPAFYDIWAIEVESGTSYYDIFGGEAGAQQNAQFWRDAATAGRAFFPTTVNATTGLGPDYADFNGAPRGGQHADFRYDAWRIAMNIGMDYSWWAKDSWQITQSNRIQTFFHGKGVDSYGALWNLNGNGPLQNGADHSPGLVACNAVASLAATQAITWDFIENFWNISTTTGQYRYYDGCLYMMGLLHVSGKFKAYLSSSSTAPSSSITPTTATFDKNTAGANYQDIAVTMTLNGNTLSSIKNGNTTLTSGSAYTVSGSTVTIKKEYLVAQAVGTTTLTFTFSAGSARTIAITIGDTTGGGPIGGTILEHTFDADVAATFAPAGSSSTAARTVNGGNNVLQITIQTKDDVVILPFNLGSTTLANYASLYVEVAATSGDSTFKSFVAQVTTGTFGKGDSSSNTTIARQDGNALGGSGSWGMYTIPLQNNSGAIGALTGPVNIAFWLPNANPGAVYQIRVLRLIPKN